LILTVGLTGGIASGKSTISRLFGDLGCVTIDADEVVASLYQPGAAGHAALVRTYGPRILDAQGEIDRPKLADIAFATPAAAQQLNALIHPLVIAEERRRLGEIAEQRPGEDLIVLVEATLLIEAGGRARYDRVVVVDVPRDVQIARAIGRGMPREEVERRIARQMPREERLRYADYVIDNGGDPAAEVRRVYEALVRDLAKKK
jgi:dephospho-CoA kinase